MPPTSSPSPAPDRRGSEVEAPTSGASRWLEAAQAWRLPRGLVVLLATAGAVVSAAGLHSAADIVGPAFLALTIAITVHPLLAWLQRHSVPSWLAVGLTGLTTYAALLALAAALAVSTARLVILLPNYQSQFTSLVDQATRWLGEVGVTQQQINSAVSHFNPTSLVGVLQRVLSGATSVLSGLLFIVLLLFFLIMDSSSLPRRLAPARAQRPQLVEALASFAHATRQYVVVSTVFGLIVALVDVAALYWLSVPLPWLWGLLSFITNYIPNIGFVLGLVPPALLALLEGGVRQAVLVIVAYSVINTVIQSLIQPKVVGDTVGLSVSLTFLSLVFWSYVIGPLGALLAVPLSLFTKATLIDADPTTRWLDPLLSTGGRADRDRSDRKEGVGHQ